MTHQGLAQVASRLAAATLSKGEAESQVEAQQKERGPRRSCGAAPAQLWRQSAAGFWVPRLVCDSQPPEMVTGSWFLGTGWLTYSSWGFLWWVIMGTATWMVNGDL